MILFLLRGDPAFRFLIPAPGQEWHAQGGKAIVEPWREIEFIYPSESEDFISADCLSINTGTDGLIFSRHALDILSDPLAKTGEFWPVRVMGHSYWWYNCTHVVKALDYEKTDADWSIVEGSWGSMKWISSTRSLAFRQSQIRQAPILFRIPEFPQGLLFAQDALRNLARESNLTGMRFDLVWSADLGGVFDPPGVGFGGMFTANFDEDFESRRQAVQKILSDRKRKGIT